jgi:hypothetical protein
MTVIVAVRTGSAVVLAADSKLTTQAVAGKNADGTPRWLPQSYDFATKVVEDASHTAVAAFAGNGNIGEHNASDYFARLSAHLNVTAVSQDARVSEIASDMALARKTLAAKIGIGADQVPPTTVLLVAASDGATAPRVWRIELQSATPKIDEILKTPNVWFEGSTASIFALMYGAIPSYEFAIRGHPKMDQAVFDAAKTEALHHCPIKQINFWTMPIQDAMDFATFCATVQVEMERFLPGLAACGGPIDLVIVETSPNRRIRQFPGKVLHHPVVR